MVHINPLRKYRDTEEREITVEQVPAMVTDIVRTNVVCGLYYKDMGQAKDYKNQTEALRAYYENALATLCEHGLECYTAALLLADEWPVQLKRERAHAKKTR